MCLIFGAPSQCRLVVVLLYHYDNVTWHIFHACKFNTHKEGRDAAQLCWKRHIMENQLVVGGKWKSLTYNANTLWVKCQTAQCNLIKACKVKLASLCLVLLQKSSTSSFVSTIHFIHYHKLCYDKTKLVELNNIVAELEDTQSCLLQATASSYFYRTLFVFNYIQKVYE